MIIKKDKTVHSLGQFLAAVKKTVARNGKTTQYRFTGIKDSNFNLIPSLYCKTDYLPFNHDVERQIVYGATYQYPNLFDAEHPVSMRNLALLRHYGVPVRLMDTTTNPLVALWMACTANDDDTTKSHASNAAVCILKFDFNNNEIFDWNNPYFDEILRLGFEPNGLSEKEFRGKFPHLAEFVRFFGGFAEKTAWDRLGTPKLVLSPYFTERQKAQSGQFVFFPPHFNLCDNNTRIVFSEHCATGANGQGTTGITYSPSRTIANYNKQLESNVVKKLLIPRKEAKIIIEDLRQVAGVSQVSLFPENIDSGVNDLIRRLTP